MLDALARLKKVMPGVAQAASRPPRAVGGALDDVGRSASDLDRELAGRNIGEPDASDGAAAGARRVKTGLPREIDDLVALTPSLSRDIRQLQQQGWTFEFGSGHPHTDYHGKKIRVPGSSFINAPVPDSAMVAFSEIPITPIDSAHHLARQVGYARRGSVLGNFAPPDPDDTFARWQERQVRKQLNREAGAHLTGALARREILDNDGPDISTGYADDPMVQEAQRLADNIADPSVSTSWNEGVRELGEFFGGRPHPSLPSATRLDSYRAAAEDEWNNFHGNGWRQEPPP